MGDLNDDSRKGQWWTHLSFPLVGRGNAGIEELLGPVVRGLEGLGLGCTGIAPDEWHLSLSKNFPLSYMQIDPFVALLKSRLEGTQSIPLSLSLDRPEVFLGQPKAAGQDGGLEEPQRAFVALRVTTGIPELLDLVRAVDGAVAEFGGPGYYEHPIFHVSVAWAPASQYKTLQTGLTKKGLPGLGGEDGVAASVFLDHVRVMCGDGARRYAVPLR
ncbi:hypothetical protein PAPYR_1462 [Paratrimastix pyriformis]|uniref:U6 snRNA phosphodiesterase 1 n=1 Tax=Paratrimastix pyriformis TaxID=342808 RepID=A0ABQ8UYI0_9EUKA|nr:hypothetical protein PAPYR_1462 [Paratrimastix pyriformis]